MDRFYFKETDNMKKLKELLEAQNEIFETLKEKGIIRTNNNVVGDLSEKLFADAFNLTLAKNSTCGYDCVSDKGVRYQVKGRKCPKEQNSISFGAIRDLKKNKFDFLCFVVFDDLYNIRKAAILPKQHVEKLSKYQEHTNSHILNINLNKIGAISDIQDVTGIISSTLNGL